MKLVQFMSQLLNLFVHTNIYTLGLLEIKAFQSEGLFLC